jgi:hypothetical protein
MENIIYYMESVYKFYIMVPIVVNNQNSLVPLLPPSIPLIAIIAPFIDSGMEYPSRTYGYL